MILTFEFMEDLRLTTVQTPLDWQDIEANLQRFDALLQKIEIPTDIVLLPEMFSTGFSMEAEKLAEKESGSAVNWMKEKAAELNAVVAGSLIIEDSGNYYNRLFWMQPDGSYLTYDKRHLFSLANEQDHYTAGQKRLIVKYKGWRICPLICFDLRFPVWSRNNHAYDLVFYVANWPARRNFAWKNLLVARAIENQSYVVGLNRVGADGNGVDHSGDTAVLDPLGQKISTTKPNETRVETVTLSAENLTQVRKKFQFLNDQDQFEIRETY